MKTHTEFLEELKNDLKWEIKIWEKYPMTYADRIMANESVIDKIEQFESELKQVDDEQERPE